METCLVTGGAGLIGSHLIDRLLGKYRVICVDGLNSGSIKNVQAHFDDKNFVFIEADISRPLNIAENVDYVFHLASRASPVDFPRHAVEILLTNSLGTHNVLELARRQKGARFLLASSSEVYGDPMIHPQKEDYYGNVNTLGVRGCYDEGKRFSEALCMSYYRKYRLGVRIARIFNTYGPRMRIDDGRVIPTFITQALRGDDITVSGLGQQTRTFCYVSDTVEGLIGFMFARNVDGLAMNIGGLQEKPVIEVARMIKRMTGSSSGIVFTQQQENDPRKRRPDISLANSLLGWSPKVSFEDGLKRTIEYFASL